MTRVIEQVVTFNKVTPAELYELFMDSAKHTAATGMPAKIDRKANGKWSAFGGMILGRNLMFQCRAGLDRMGLALVRLEEGRSGFRPDPSLCKNSRRSSSTSCPCRRASIRPQGSR